MTVEKGLLASGSFLKLDECQKAVPVIQDNVQMYVIILTFYWVMDHI